jgi:hypothetical protein
MRSSCCAQAAGRASLSPAGPVDGWPTFAREDERDSAPIAEAFAAGALPRTDDNCSLAGKPHGKSSVRYRAEGDSRIRISASANDAVNCRY